jgi:hypothetical protein
VSQSTPDLRRQALRVFSQIISGGDLALADELIAADYVDHRGGRRPALRGRAAGRALARGRRARPAPPIGRPPHPRSRLIEELAPWLGHLVSGAIDLVELPDGALWIAHNGGVTSVSAAARVRPTEPPPVLIHEVRVNGDVTRGSDLTLPSRDAMLGLRFLAASWRAPALLRYRLHIDDTAWSAPIEAGWFGVRGLPSGPHTVEIAASLDGVRWTEPPARLAFVVPRPWYGRPEPLRQGILPADAVSTTTRRIVRRLRRAPRPSAPKGTAGERRLRRRRTQGVSGTAGDDPSHTVNGFP